MLHTLLVKRFNDLLDGQKSQRSIDKVTFFYVGDLFCIHLGTKYANFQEKIFVDISGRKFQTLYSSNMQIFCIRWIFKYFQTSPKRASNNMMIYLWTNQTQENLAELQDIKNPKIY